MTTTREGRLLKTSMGLALVLLLLAPLASFAGWGVSVGVGFGGPARVWVPGYYGYYGWVPGYYAVPPYAGAIWVGPRWVGYGYHRHFYGGYWRHGYYRHGYRRW